MRVRYLAVVLCSSLMFAACDDDDDNGPTYAISLEIYRGDTSPVRLDWNDLADDEGYRIYRSDDGAAAAVIHDAAADAITYNDNSTVNGVKYVYHVVKLVGATETADRSNPVTADYAKVHTPANGETLTIGTMYNITWEGYVSIGSDWRIWASTDGGSTWELLCDSGAVSPFAWKVGYKSSGAVPNQTQFITVTQPNCVVMVQDYDNDWLSDLSDGAFTCSP